MASVTVLFCRRTRDEKSFTGASETLYCEAQRLSTLALNSCLFPDVSMATGPSGRGRVHRTRPSGLAQMFPLTDSWEHKVNSLSHITGMDQTCFLSAGRWEEYGRIELDAASTWSRLNASDFGLCASRRMEPSGRLFNFPGRPALENYGRR